MPDDQNLTNPQNDFAAADPSTPSDPLTPNIQQPTNESILSDPYDLQRNKIPNVNEASDQTPESNLNNPTQFNQEEVVLAPHTPKKYGGSKVIATIFGVVVLIGGIAAGVILVQRQQQIEERAASGRECQQAADCILLDEPGNSGSFSAPEEIVKVDITAKDVYTYLPGTTEDGCYRVKIEGRNISWQKYGSGPKCKDVSNAQIKFRKSMGYIKICHYTSDPSAHPWQAIEISQQAWDLGHDDAHNFKKTQYDFLYTNTDPNCPWPEPGNQGITCADLWCEKNAPPIFPEICNKNCTTDNDCALPSESSSTEVPNNYICYQPPFYCPPGENCPDVMPPKVCRNTNCPTEENCICETPAPVTAKCSVVKAYNTSWNPLSLTQLNELNPGTKVRFAVSGESGSGTFDKARFSVNNVSLGETTLKKPGSDEFYTEYTIPTNTASFTVEAEIHHSILGWF